MESTKKSSLKRKPLSDCTNTHRNLRSAKLTSQTLIKPLKKPSVVVVAPPITNSINQKRSQNLDFNSIDSGVVSTGSNNSPKSDTAPSHPATPLSRAGDIVVGKATRLSATQSQRQNEQTRKDKRESVEATPIVQASAYLTSRSMPAISGYGGHASRPPVVEICEVDEQKRKDKGKMVVETPIIQISTPLTSHLQQTSSSAASGNCYLPGPSAEHSHKQDALTNKGSIKIGQATPIEEFRPAMPHPLIMPSSDSFGDLVGSASRISTAQTQRQNELTKKDKGKSIEALQASKYLISQLVQRSSPAVSRNVDEVIRPPVGQHGGVDEQKRKDKGKMVVEIPMIQISTPLTSHTMQISSSSASGNCYLPGPSAVHSHKQDAQANKDKIKIGQEMPNFAGFDPTTPHPLIISSDASGTNHKEKTGLTVYNQRRASQRKKIGVGSISWPFSCPVDKKTKKKGVELDGGAYGNTGSNTDPLPKKKRPRNKKTECAHAMAQDEIAKLKAYYADIDAFELPEEVASDNE